MHLNRHKTQPIYYCYNQKLGFPLGTTVNDHINNICSFLKPARANLRVTSYSFLREGFCLSSLNEVIKWNLSVVFDLSSRTICSFLKEFQSLNDESIDYFYYQKGLGYIGQKTAAYVLLQDHFLSWRMLQRSTASVMRTKPLVILRQKTLELTSGFYWRNAIESQSSVEQQCLD